MSYPSNRKTELAWAGTFTNSWPAFDTLEMPQAGTAHGVYIVWWGISDPKVLYVGRGDIGNRLWAHTSDARFVDYTRHFQLYCTWASVDKEQVEGVEAYLIEILEPELNERSPQASPIPVNVPWQSKEDRLAELFRAF